MEPRARRPWMMLSREGGFAGRAQRHLQVWMAWSPAPEPWVAGAELQRESMGGMHFSRKHLGLRIKKASPSWRSAIQHAHITSWSSPWGSRIQWWSLPRQEAFELLGVTPDTRVLLCFLLIIPKLTPVGLLWSAASNSEYGSREQAFLKTPGGSGLQWGLGSGWAPWRMVEF